MKECECDSECNFVISNFQKCDMEEEIRRLRLENEQLKRLRAADVSGTTKLFCVMENLTHALNIFPTT